MSKKLEIFDRIKRGVAFTEEEANIVGKALHLYEQNKKALRLLKEIFMLKVYEKQGQYFISSGFGADQTISKKDFEMLREVLL